MCVCVYILCVWVNVSSAANRSLEGDSLVHVVERLGGRVIWPDTDAFVKVKVTCSSPFAPGGKPRSLLSCCYSTWAASRFKVKGVCDVHNKIHLSLFRCRYDIYKHQLLVIKNVVVKCTIFGWHCQWTVKYPSCNLHSLVVWKRYHRQWGLQETMIMLLVIIDLVPLYRIGILKLDFVTHTRQQGCKLVIVNYLASTNVIRSKAILC